MVGKRFKIASSALTEADRSNRERIVEYCFLQWKNGTFSHLQENHVHTNHKPLLASFKKSLSLLRQNAPKECYSDFKDMIWIYISAPERNW